jgi:pimeloyl-ACP methyl ester carboxylesterase
VSAIVGGREERALWLPSGSQRLFAILHEPTGPERRDNAVLVCPPFGWEEESAHRGLVNWSRSLADAGYATLRIDYPGTRDSSGGRQERRLETWKAGVADAAAWLRADSGCARVTALGIGLGGVIAVDAACDGAQIDDLVLWGVPSAGRAVMRELRMKARVIAAAFPDDAVPIGPDSPLEAIGFALDADAVAELEAVALADRPLPPGAGRRALLLGRDGLAVDARLQAALSEAGVAVTAADGTGHALLTDHPQTSRAPQATIAAMIAWLEQAQSPELSPRAGDHRPPASSAESTVELMHEDVPLRETALRMHGRDGQELFVIITEPVLPSQEPVCAVMLNSGSLSHVGPSRTWVELARRRAAAGITSVRVDFPGIGEVDGDGDRLEDDAAFYEPVFVSTTLGLLDALDERGLPDRFVLCGLCSGAYWAWQAALQDERVVGLQLLNLWAFFYDPGLSAEREPGDSLLKLREQGIRQILRNGVTAEKLGKAVRSIRPSHVLAGARHEIEQAQLERITTSLDTLRDRGTEISMLFTLGEQNYEQMERQELLDQSARWPQLSIDRIPSWDHMSRTLELQRLVHAHLDDGMRRVLDRIARPVGAPPS